ncbi:hypothetical protein Bbelb_394240 [Branchiostoma belcheri]|nr:hypothetical protein Bbelb_394240 [Branchiostoma belcheri]
MTYLSELPETVAAVMRNTFQTERNKEIQTPPKDLRLGLPDGGPSPPPPAQLFSRTPGCEAPAHRLKGSKQSSRRRSGRSSDATLGYFMQCQGNGTNTGATPVGAYRLDPPTGRR